MCQYFPIHSRIQHAKWGMGIFPFLNQLNGFSILAMEKVYLQTKFGAFGFIL